MIDKHNANQLIFPDFVGIGAQRCGTTWLYEMLKSHPQIRMSTEKELNFFNVNYHRGIEWYQKFFIGTPSHMICGEYSPRYLANKNTPKRIKQTIPGAKLLVSLRNPVEQVFSRYNYKVKMHFTINISADFWNISIGIEF
jgi:hypothetical protein